MEHNQVVVLDGAIGTEILRRDVTWADHQLLSRPDVVRSIHADYLAAGADVLSTNTFQLTRRYTMRFRKLEALSTRTPNTPPHGRKHGERFRASEQRTPTIFMGLCR